jgi:hypothetical protein
MTVDGPSTSVGKLSNITILKSRIEKIIFPFPSKPLCLDFILEKMCKITWHLLIISTFPRGVNGRH